MADRPDDAYYRTLAQLWDAADLRNRAPIIGRHGATTIETTLAAQGSLRVAQLPPPGDWAIWVILAGRGFGKTRAGAEWVHALATEAPRRFALVGTTLENARSVMVEGESGLLARVPPGGSVSFVPSQRQLTWDNGSQARLFSGGEPDSLRGSQFDFAWGDEFAHWPRGQETLTNLRLATRLGADPRLLLSTTPLPLAWLKALLAEPGVKVTRGRMHDNRANLPIHFIDHLQRRYGGSGASPDRADALVWALTALMLGGKAARPSVRRI